MASKPRQVRLRPQNPFDLIRLLARSQSDPRKAVAELVQNSLDAGARHIEIVWFNDKRRRALRIWDDGQGVFPELEREEALRRIARTVGHSHKRDLTPAQRREHLVLGQYGIGLIGFWGVAEVLEMKSRVGGGKSLVLRLREERESGEVFASRSRTLDEHPTYTEITLRNVHEAAIPRIRPPRLQAFLANELRGQLLERNAVVRIRDRVARGLARKEFLVEPRPYLGRPLEDLREIEVPGFESARVELYLVAPEEDRHGVVALSCGGTTVLDDIAEIDGIDALRAPWSGGRLEGVIDFPELHVAPGSRRGFSHDEPVTAFLAALEQLEQRLELLLEEERRLRSARRQENLAKEIRRAFRSVAQQLPEYDFFAVTPKPPRPAGGDPSEPGPSASPDAPLSGEPSSAPGDAPGSAPGEPFADGPPSAADTSPAPGPELTDSEPAEPEPADDQLFPPGPLASVELSPAKLRIAPLAARSLRARPLDEEGRSAAGPVSWSWSLDGPGELLPGGSSARYTAPDATLDAPPPIEVLVTATQGPTSCTARARIQLAPPEAATRLQGIPDPHPVAAPREAWRSRVRDGRWEYNEAHRDYLAVADVEARRLRYLIHLFSKEVVLRNFGRPGDDEVLERMVEVLTRLEGSGRR